MSTLTTPEGGNDAAALAGLAQSASERVKKLMGAYLLGHTLWKGGKALWTRAKSEFSHTITVDSRDDLYPDVMAWLYDTIPEEKRRSLRATSTQTDSNAVVASDGGPSVPAKLHLHYDGQRAQTVSIEGHRIKVEVSTDTDPGRDSSGNYTYKVDKVTFTAADVDGRAAVLKFLESAAVTRVRTGPRLYMGTRWGDWRRAGSAPVRDFATVALPPGVEQDMVADLEAFLSQESDYARLGIPWHRGFLLHGPPGCGKTTIAKALAAKFDLDTYFLPLSDMEDDTGLMRMFSEVDRGSMLLLEDIDIAAATRERDDQGKGVSMSALLQGLDGIVTAWGVIVVMTTNNLDVLDPALIRPGRADRIYEVTYLDKAQFEALVHQMTGLQRDLPDPEGLELTPADVVGVLKDHIGRPAAAVEAVACLVAAAREAIHARS